MTNLAIGYRNRADDALTLYGGSWAAALPLTNLRNRNLGRVARTSSLALTTTTFGFTFASAVTFQMIALAGHNLSPSAQVRIRASNEAAATNYLLKSERLDDVYWVKSNITAFTNARLAPDGLVTMTALQENTTGVVDHYVRSTPFAKPALQQYWTASVYLKADQRTFAKVQAIDGVSGTTRMEVVVNLNTGAVVGGVSAFGTLSDPSCVVTSASNGIWRVQLTALWDAGTTQLTCWVWPMLNSTTASYAGVVGQGLYAWGAQFEQGAAASSYIATDTVAVTRAAGQMNSWTTTSDNPSVIYDAGLGPVWPVSMTADMLEDYTRTFINKMPTPITALGWRIDLSDPTNTDGYVQIGRLFAGALWSPTRNMAYGASLGWEDNSEVQEALSGAEYFVEKRPYRVARFTTPQMTIAEGMTSAFDVQRRSGVTGEVVFMFVGDDTTYRLERSFLGRLRQLSPLEYFNAGVTKAGWEVKELL